MIYYFVFDHFNPSSPEDYWKTEAGCEVPEWVRHIAQDELVRKSVSQIKPADWDNEDVVAAMKINSERACLFRVYCGGLDIKGRGNRWVILLAEGPRKEFEGTDILSVAKCGAFEKFKSFSQEKDVRVPEITQREWMKMPPDTSLRICSGTLEISDASMLQKISLALTSNKNALESTIWVEKRGEKVMAKANVTNEGIKGGTERMGAQSKEKSRWFIRVLSLVFMVVLGALMPTWLWINARRGYEMQKEKNDDLCQQISRSQGRSERKIKNLERDLTDLKKRNSYFESENRRLRENLQRHESFWANVEKLESRAEEFREKINQCTHELSETLNEIRREFEQ